MPETVTSAVESSPAAPAAPSNATFVAPTEAKARAEWLQTGNVPEPKRATPKEESAPSKDSSASGDEPDENSAPASEAGKSKQEPRPHRSNADTRLNEILADLKRAGLSPAELKTFKREAQAASSGEKDVKPASSPAPKTDALQAPQKPDFANWKGTWEEMEAAKEKYFEELADFKAQKAVQDFQQRTAQQQMQREMLQKVSEAEKRYGPEASSTIESTARAIQAADSGVPTAIKQLIWESPVIADLVYVMGSKPADFQEFLETARTNPVAAVRKVVLLEHLVQQELAKGPKTSDPPADAAEPPAAAGDRDDSGRFTKAPAKQVSKAPPPAEEVSGRSSAPPDESDRAFNSGDFEAFRNAENRKDIARLKGL